MENNDKLFRKKTLERISSPEQLTDYLKVTGPGVWMILITVLLLLGGILVWASIGTLETKTDVVVRVEDHRAVAAAPGGAELREGMPLRVSGKESAIASIEKDEYGRSTGIAELELPDGTYDGIVVTDTAHAIDFLFESR